ncbi:hypothetical protein KOR34_42080 [Posidoniimonas corsicana]|uniref:DUF1559 domain-containing protein n=1 Tax=Posidoniimonas corsicana TaxID=1938618 RepID=A0A5C5V422_9BACT|nr:DUF1559 domain-containing protein [Posidoniimonas corsicana]TWT32445.1 hypothetical protein KOR34_42080 [Posidoniimonas corsicana]
MSDVAVNFRHARSRRRGVSLVEMLVVVAIIGMLAALLLPAIQASREASRRGQCQNNLRQIGLAIQVYNDHHGHYPSARDQTGVYGASWAFELLPYLEQQAQHDSFLPTVRVDDDRNAAAMRTPVALYFCPTRRPPAADRDFDNGGSPPRVRGVAAGGDYAANAGLHHNYKTPPELGGPDHPLAMSITAGPIYTKSRVTDRHVTDGLSKTFAVGERHTPMEDVAAGEPEVRDLRLGDTAYFAADTAAAILGGSRWGLATGPRDANVFKFGSAHAGVTFFVFLDCHTVAVPSDVDLAVLQEGSVIGDGGQVSTAEYPW